MSNTRIIYIPHPNVTPEREAAVLAAVYSFVLRAHENKKKAVPADGPDDAKGSNEHDRATESISR